MPKRSHTWLVLLVAVACAAAVAASSTGCRQTPRELVVGVVASTVPSEGQGEAGEAAHAMLSSAFQQNSGMLAVVFRFESSAALVRALTSGQVDIGLLNPFAYVVAHDTGGAQVILRSVRNGTDHSRSQFIALVESGPQTLDELRGKAVAFVDPASPSGYLFPAAHLLDLGIEPERDLGEVRFMDTQAEVVLAVLDGRVQAGACREDARELIYGEVRDVFERVAVIGYTPAVPNDAIVVRAGFTAAEVARIKQALQAVTAAGDGRRAWKALTGAERLIEADDTDYDVIREMAGALGLNIEGMVGVGD